MIAVFDSGAGGLAILTSIRESMPRANLTYLSDNVFFPYGEKDSNSIIRRSEEISRLLLDRGARLIVVACNTATVVAIEHLRQIFPVPFVGVEPAVKVAAEVYKGNPTVVLSTSNTAVGVKYRKLVERWSDESSIIQVRVPLLAQMVEEGKFRDQSVRQEAMRQVRSQLPQFPENSPLNVVLGCTHYIFLEEFIAEIFGSRANIIEPSDAVAAQVVRVVELLGDTAQEEQSGTLNFLTSGDPAILAAQVEMLLGYPKAQAERISIED